MRGIGDLCQPHVLCRLVPTDPASVAGLAQTSCFQDYLDALQVIRDFCSWSGLRQVSKKTFLRALEDRGSVMLVPGGQAELVHTWKAHLKRPQYVVYTRHKGGPRLCVQDPGFHTSPEGTSGRADGLCLDVVPQGTHSRRGVHIPTACCMAFG